MQVCFNTQPPEGGWAVRSSLIICNLCFNTQPPEGGWLFLPESFPRNSGVSTHSRPKAAGVTTATAKTASFCFNTQPPEGGWGDESPKRQNPIRFNTQPPEGGWRMTPRAFCGVSVFQHTAARRRLGPRFRHADQSIRFQHTAARRRLGSRATPYQALISFNTQPPEGGWAYCRTAGLQAASFQHTAARRRLGPYVR